MCKLGPGSYTSHHWEAPVVIHQDHEVHVWGRNYVTSPFAFRERMQIAVDGGPFSYFGTVRWKRVDE